MSEWYSVVMLRSYRHQTHEVGSCLRYVAANRCPHRFETSSQQIQSGSSVLDDVTNKLRSCPSEFYILVSQAGAHASDYESRDSAPRLREKVLEKDGPVKSSFMVNEVVGDVDIHSLQSMLESTCGAGATEVHAGTFVQFLTGTVNARLVDYGRYEETNRKHRGLHPLAVGLQEPAADCQPQFPPLTRGLVRALVQW